MGLTEEADEEKTVQAVRDFFLKDDGRHRRNYSKIRRGYYGVMGVQAPVFDVTGIHGSGGNGTENKWLASMPYKHAIELINRAIGSCELISRQILVYRYCERQTVQTAMREANISSHDRYYSADFWACYQFADSIDGLLSYQNDEIIRLFPDLLIMKSE